jgi:archaellum component FlaC
MAASGTAKAKNSVAKLTKMLANLKDKLLTVKLQSVLTITKYAIALYLITETGQMIYQSWLYESHFESSGLSIQNIKRELQECDVKIKILYTLVEQSEDLLEAETRQMKVRKSGPASRVWSAFTEEHQAFAETQSEFEKIVQKFETTRDEIYKILSKCEVELESLDEKARTERADRQEQKEGFNRITARSVLLFSLLIATRYFSGGVVLEAVDVVPAGLTVLCWLMARDANIKKEQAEQRLRIFAEMQVQVDLLRDTVRELNKLMQQQKQKMQQLKQEHKRRKKTRAGKDRVVESVENIARFIPGKKELHWLLQLFLYDLAQSFNVLLIMSTLMFFAYKQSSSLPLTPASFVTWLFVIVISWVVILACIDLSQAKRSTVTELKRRNYEDAKTSQQYSMEKYNRECIWYEKPSYIQMARTTLAHLVNWMPIVGSEYGFDSISRNASGNMQNKYCFELEKQMSDIGLNKKKQDIEIEIEAYAYPIKGAGNVLVEFVAQSFETLNVNTSATTKLFAFGTFIFILFILIVMRFIRK